jgi:hypothetical protein
MLRNKGLVLLTLLILAVFAQGMGWPPPAPEKEWATSEVGVTAGIFTDKTTYDLGEQVQMTLIVKNESAEMIESSFSSSQSFDFIIYDEKMDEVRRWSHDKMFAMALRPFKLSPGGSVEYDWTWTQLDNANQPVPAGKYFVQGQLTLLPRVNTPKISISIQ